MSDAAWLSRWQSLDRTLSDLEHDCQDFEQQADRWLDELDRLRREVQRQAELLASARQKLAQRERELAEQRTENSRLTEQLDRHEAQLAELLAVLKGFQGSAALGACADDEELTDALQEQFDEQDQLHTLAAQFAQLQ